MQFHDFDRPVINLHELTNGLNRYYSPDFNREIVSKHGLKSWDYFQSLQEIIEILESVDHYKTSRLAHYHIVRRGDSQAQQIPFYNYLNENFYIIACERENIFEHALSMALSKVTRKLNVYSTLDKVETFLGIYQNGINLDLSSMIGSLDAYRDYLSWRKQYFNISSYFCYEKDLPGIEKFILNLPIFNQTKKITWKENFDIEFDDWNRFAYLKSNIGSLIQGPDKQNLLAFRQKLLPHTDTAEAIVEYQKHALPSWPAIHSAEDFASLPQDIKDQFEKNRIDRLDLSQFQTINDQRFLEENQTNFSRVQKTLDRMVDLGIMVTVPPIKKQTLEEKKKIIKNFDQCVKVFNRWCKNNPEIAEPIDEDGLSQQSQQERKFWISDDKPSDLLSYQPPTG